MSELPEGVEPAVAPAPRDSALGVVIRRGKDGVEILFGRRARTARFMPGHLAFPGGGFEKEDRPGELGAAERCASREVLEETGIDVPADSWLDGSFRITPPLYPVRFRARFRVAEVAPGTEPADPPPTTENEWLGFLPPAEVVARFEEDRDAVPPPVLAALRGIASLAPGATVDRFAEAVARANRGEEDVPRIEFVRDIWMLPVPSRTLPPATHTNAWIPVGERSVVVDPGANEDRDCARLVEVARRAQREVGAEPAAVLLTHFHQDHVDGATRVADALDVPVLAHEETLRRVPGLRDTRPIAHDETIDLGGLTLRAIDTPGHAPGHLAFLVPERDVLISGDLASALSTMLIHPDAGDMSAYLASLERAQATGARRLLPGHGGLLPAKALARVAAHRRERERRVLDAWAAGVRDLESLAREAYADTPDADPRLARLQTRAHWVDLRRRGEVDGPDPAGGAPGS